MVQLGARWFTSRALRSGLSSLAGASLTLFAAAAAAQQPASVMTGLDSLLSIPVSTGARYAQDIRQVSGSVSIVTAEDIRRFGYRSIEEVLQSESGFYLTNNQVYTYVGVRGFGRSNDHNNRILLLLDGHTVNQGLTGSSQISSSMVLELSMVKRIEIIRGPASALYGTGALLAVVNIITEAADEHGVMARAGTGSDGFVASSVTAGTQVGALHLGFTGKWDHETGADMFIPEFNTPANNNGIAHNLDAETHSGFYATAELGSFSLRGRYGYRTKSIPNAPYGSEFNHPGTSSKDESGSIELQYEADLSDNKHLSIRSYADEYSITGNLFTNGAQSSQGHNHMVGGEAAFRWDPFARSRLTIGLEYRNNTVVTFRAVSPVFNIKFVDQPFSVLSLYAQEDLQLTSKLSLLAGIRHDQNSITRAATTPRIALIFDPRPGTTLKAMYGRAFRAPSALEDGTRKFPLQGHLVPERLTMAEGIWIQRINEAFALTASVYQYRVEHLIDQVFDSLAPLAYINQDRVNARGVEVQVDARPSAGTRAYGNLSIQRATDSEGPDNGRILTNSPERLLKIGIATDIGSRISLATEISGESYRLTRNGASTSAPFLAGVNLLLRPFHFAEVSVRLDNVFNTRYAHPAGAELIPDTIEQDGRVFSVFLTTRF